MRNWECEIRSGKLSVRDRTRGKDRDYSAAAENESTRVAGERLGGRGWSEARVKPRSTFWQSTLRGFLRRLSPALATLQTEPLFRRLFLHLLKQLPDVLRAMPLPVVLEVGLFDPAFDAVRQRRRQRASHSVRLQLEQFDQVRR